MRPEEPVARIMTESVVVIEADRPVSEALDCFLQYAIHHLPVVRQGRLAGMLSSADLMKLEFFVPRGAADRAAYVDQRFHIGQIMRTPVVSRSVNTTIGEAAELMIEAAVHALPLVDDDERVVGIVSTTDIIRSLLRGPPRRGDAGADAVPGTVPAADVGEEPHYHRKPTPAEYTTALLAATTLHVEAHDPKFLGKVLLYLDQRRTMLERVLERADRFLVAGQDEHNHAQLLKAILAAKRVEEHATGDACVPFPLD